MSSESQASSARGAPSESRLPISRGQRLQHIFDTISDMVVLIEREEDGGYRCLEANDAVSRMEGIPLEAMVGRRVDDIHPPEVYAHWKAIYDKVVETGAPLEVEHDVESPLGRRHRVTRFFPVPGDGPGTRLLMGVCRDVTETRAALAARDAQMRRLVAVNRVSEALAQDLDVETVLQRTTEILLDVFSADRAWLAYPLDPSAPSFHLPFISSRPEYPGPPRHAEVPMDAVSAAIVREAFEAEGPVAYDPDRPVPGGQAYRDMFGIRSQMLMAIRLKGGETWCVGLHQCSHERAWTPEDRELYRDIVSRIKTSLENLLLHRDLKRSREFHHLMTEVMPQLVWTTDGAGRVSFVNGRWLEYTGQAHDHAVSTGGVDALHPEDLETCLSAWNRSIATGEPYEAELRYRRADGEYLWHLTRAYPIRDESGAVTHWIGTCTDISEAKRVQAEAARARRELEVILQGVGEGISAQDTDGRIIFANPRFAEMSGYPDPRALMAAPLAERKDRYVMSDEAGKPLAWKDLPGRRVLAGEDEASVVMRLEDRVAGTERWVHAKSYAVRGPDGRVALAINFSQDITAVREAREELVRSKEQLATILAGAGESIVALDPDGRIVYANEAATRLFGMPLAGSPLDAAGSAPPGPGAEALRFFDESGHPIPADDLPTRVARRGLDAPPRIVRFRKGEKGPDRWAIARAKPIFGEDGAVSLVIGMAQDITELKEKEEAVRRLQKMESLGKLAGGIAHDFNNLLVTINGYSELGLQGSPGREETEEYFREILRSGQRAAALTQQLLAYSRKQVVLARPLSLNAVVSDMEKMLRRLIGEDIRMRSDLAPDLPLVEADPSQVEQVLLNLVLNARDAMPGGGDLLLETRACRLDADALEGNPDARPGDFVRLTVSDTGTGMTPEVMERAFDPFFTTKDVGKGTGLGLASVYGIVKQAGGHITVRSAPGKGADFAIHLPASAKAASADPARQALREARSRRRETILLVEDEDSVRGFTRRVLVERGFTVIEARDGEEALRKAAGLPELHLLLTDVVMPGLRGTALSEEVAKLHPEARVLLMSGYLEEGLSEGRGERFLQKPFRTEELLARVDSVLGPAAPA